MPHLLPVQEMTLRFPAAATEENDGQGDEGDPRDDLGDPVPRWRRRAGGGDDTSLTCYIEPARNDQLKSARGTVNLPELDPDERTSAEGECERIARSGLRCSPPGDPERSMGNRATTTGSTAIPTSTTRTSTVRGLRAPRDGARRLRAPRDGTRGLRAPRFIRGERRALRLQGGGGTCTARAARSVRMPVHARCARGCDKYHPQTLPDLAIAD